MQAEVKKAWLRRSLAIDLKQKARVASSAGGGSGYYGGMMSHTATQSVCLSVSGTKGLPLGTMGCKGQSRLHTSGNLPGYALKEDGNVTCRNIRATDNDLEPSFVADEEYSGSLSWKELETML